MSDREVDRTGAAGVADTARGDRAQYGVCAALAGLGVLLLVDAMRIPPVTSSNDPLGPRLKPAAWPRRGVVHAPAEVLEQVPRPAKSAGRLSPPLVAARR